MRRFGARGALTIVVVQGGSHSTHTHTHSHTHAQTHSLAHSPFPFPPKTSRASTRAGRTSSEAHTVGDLTTAPVTHGECLGRLCQCVPVAPWVERLISERLPETANEVRSWIETQWKNYVGLEGAATTQTGSVWPIAFFYNALHGSFPAAFHKNRN